MSSTISLFANDRNSPASRMMQDMQDRMREMERNVFGHHNPQWQSQIVPRMPQHLQQNFATPHFSSDIEPAYLNKDGQNVVQWKFDCNGFNPEDLQVKLIGNDQLHISARHEDKGNNHHNVREFSRTVTVPQDVNIDSMRSSLNETGLLRVEAPVFVQRPAIESSVQIPIRHESPIGNNNHTSSIRKHHSSNTSTGYSSNNSQNGGYTYNNNNYNANNNPNNGYYTSSTSSSTKSSSNTNYNNGYNTNDYQSPPPPPLVHPTSNRVVEHKIHREETTKTKMPPTNSYKREISTPTVSVSTVDE